jgi:hypothetical protein
MNVGSGFNSVTFNSQTGIRLQAGSASKDPESSFHVQLIAQATRDQKSHLNVTGHCGIDHVLWLQHHRQLTAELHGMSHKL